MVKLQTLLYLWTNLLLAVPEKTEIYFSFITAMSGDSSAIGGIPIIDYALEEINNSTEILPNYILKHYPVKDSKCKSISALESFLSQFDNETEQEPTYLSVMCCGCSSATIPVAEISHHWNIPHISFASSDPSLNNRDRFKTFFRTLPCYVYVPPTIVTMMVEFGWSQLAIITQLQSPFTTVTKDIQTIFKAQGWRLNAGSSFNQENGEDINYKSLLNWDDGNDYRIILLNMLEVHAYHIVCEAYKKYGEQLLRQDIVLILHGRYTQEWWENERDIVSACTRKEVMNALNYTLTLTPDAYSLMDNIHTTAISGKTAPEIESIYNQLISNGNYTPLNFYGNAYDAMWTIALGLDTADRWSQDDNNSAASVCDEYAGEYVTLDEFDYRNKKMGCLLRESFQSLNFTGITGQVTFKPDGARPENVMRLRQHRVITEKIGSYTINRPTVARVVNEDTYSFGVVTYNGKGQVVFERGESYKTIWPYQNGRSPYDGTPVDVLDAMPIGITITFYCLGVLGIIAAFVCLVFNIVFRKKKAIKLGSPNLNYLIILGALLLYVSVFFFGVSVFSLENETTETILCNFRIWLFSLGYTLCFAVILAKQWRVYYIFSNPSPSKIIIKDWMLLIIIAIMLLLDGLILMVGTLVPESRLTSQPTIIENMRKNAANGVNEVVYTFVCSNKHVTAWIAVSFTYKALLQLGGIFMAFTTRKVTVKALNDTKENCALIYINSIILTILIVTQLVLNEHRNAYTSLFGLAVLVEATMFLGVVFIPKAVMLYADPDGKKVFTESQTATVQFTINTKTTDEQVTPASIKAKMAELQKQLEFLENDYGMINFDIQL